MMSESELITLFTTAKFKIFRGHAPVGTTVPFLVYHTDYNGNFGADDITFQKIPAYRLELYNTTPDLTVRESIESLLTGAGLYFKSDEVDLPDEDLFITYYYFGG